MSCALVNAFRGGVPLTSPLVTRSDRMVPDGRRRWHYVIGPILPSAICRGNRTLASARSTEISTSGRMPYFSILRYRAVPVSLTPC